MVHRQKLLDIIEELARLPCTENLGALDFLNHAAQYAKEYHGETIMSDNSARRVHAVFVRGMEQEAYSLPKERRQWLARYLYHRPAKELGMA